MDLNKVRRLKMERTWLEENLQWNSQAANVLKGNGQARAKTMTSATEALVLKRMSLEGKLKALDKRIQATAAELAAEICKRVDGGKYQTVLLLRYVDCLPWEEVAARMDYSRRQAERIHDAALMSIACAEAVEYNDA